MRSLSSIADSYTRTSRVQHIPDSCTLCLVVDIFHQRQSINQGGTIRSKLELSVFRQTPGQVSQLLTGLGRQLLLQELHSLPSRI